MTYDAADPADTGDGMPEEIQLVQVPVETFTEYEDGDVLEAQIEKAAEYADRFTEMAMIFERAESEYRNMHSTASFLAHEETEEEDFYREEIEESVASFESFEEDLYAELDALVEETTAETYEDAITEATVILSGIQIAAVPNGVHRDYDIDPDPDALADLRAYSHADVQVNPTRDPLSLFVETVRADEDDLVLQMEELNAYGMVETMEEEGSMLDAFVERDKELIERGDTSVSQDEGLYIQALKRAEERGSTVKQEMTNLTTGHEESDGHMFG